MGWTLSTIKSKVRKLTGRRSTNQLSDSDLLDYINNFYQWDFPVEVGSPEFESWYEFNTSDGTGYQDLPETILTVVPPVFIDSERASFYMDEEDFWEAFPWDQTSSDYEDEPYAVFLKGRRLYLRPVPDDTYAVKVSSKTTKPTAFSADDDEPEYEGAGPMICYGASIAIANDGGDDDLAKKLAPMYDYYKGLVLKRDVQHISIETRSMPRF